MRENHADSARTWHRQRSAGRTQRDVDLLGDGGREIREPFLQNGE